jgi:large subunit ribosomal protein L6
MSRIGKQPIEIPSGVELSVGADNVVTVKGPRGTLTQVIHPNIRVTIDGGMARVERPDDEGFNRGLHGLSRSLLANMVEGVTKGFERALEIQGVGYRAENKPFGLTLIVGLSHQVDFKAPPGVKLTAEQPTLVKVSGCDKELVGQVAANIRGVRPPEPYKGKGIRYVGEKVRRKAGKTGAK